MLEISSGSAVGEVSIENPSILKIYQQRRILSIGTVGTQQFSASIRPNFLYPSKLRDIWLDYAAFCLLGRYGLSGEAENEA